MNDYQRVLRFGWPYLRRYWQRLALGIALGIVFGATNASFVGLTNLMATRLDPGVSRAEAVAPAAPGPADTAKGLTRQWTSRISAALDPWLPRHGRAPDWRQLLGAAMILPAIVALRGVCGYLSAYCTGWVSERVVNDLRVAVVTRLSALSLDYFNRSRMGDLTTRVNGDTAALQRCLGPGFEDLIKEPVTILAVLGGMVYVNPLLALIAGVFVPVAVLPIRLLGRKARRAGSGGRVAAEKQASLMFEFLGGIRVVKAFGLEARHIERFSQHSRELVHHAMKGLQAREQVNPIIEVVAAAGFTALVVLVFVTGGSAAGTLAFLVGALLLYQPIKKLGRAHLLFQQTAPAVERLVEVLEEQTSVAERAGAHTLPAFNSAIELDDVHFAYAKQPVLQGVTLRIPRGLKLGVAGESGSGKSTFINLLFRFYDPTSGAIRIDGVDLRDVTLASLRRQMALVSQEVVIFDQSAAENIACGREGASQAEVEAAARAANADGFIRQLPQGYDTVVGERGVTLSGGQRQRLAIARAFVRNAPILVLDEATAALDSQSEAEVQAAIDQLAEQRTVVCIAHRLSTLAGMDRIIVFSQGRIVEEGGFQELLKRGGLFAGMAARQGIRPQ
jgi:ABC-type multidrug transport system fused ATPase/permease subunit